jgi:hypothetical protein
MFVMIVLSANRQNISIFFYVQIQRRAYSEESVLKFTDLTSIQVENKKLRF